MFFLIGWIVTGWIAGSVAEWLLPPSTPQPRWRTIATGIAGSMVGVIVYAVLHGSGYSPAGLVWSCGGALLCLLGERFLRGAS